MRVHQEAKKGVYATGCALRTNRLHPSILFKSPFRNTPRPWIKPSANKQAPKSVGGTRGQKWEAKQPPQHSPAVTIMQSAFQMEWPHARARLAWWRRAADEWVKCRLIFTARCCALRTPKKRRSSGRLKSVRQQRRVDRWSTWPTERARPRKVMESERVSGDLISTPRGSLA
jgi:hypothetical protein